MYRILLARRKQTNRTLWRRRLSLEVEIALHVLKRPVFWQKLLIHSWAFTQRRFSENCWRLSRIFLASFLYLYIIICYTVNWVCLEGGQEQYFPQNPMVGPSRREGEGFLRVRFVCREESGLFRTNPWPNSGRMCWLLLDSSIIMHLQKEGCDVWCRKKLVTMISILKSLSNQGSNLQNRVVRFAIFCPIFKFRTVLKSLDHFGLKLVKSFSSQTLFRGREFDLKFCIILKRTLRF